MPDGRRRVVIEGITPAVDCGRFPAKRTVGDQVRVEADIFTDGHDAIAASLLAHREGFEGWTEIPMRPLVNDRWTAIVPRRRAGPLRIQGAGLGRSLRNLASRSAQAHQG